MARQIQLNISLEPIFEHDAKTDLYIIWYKEFPGAFAEGRTIEEAESNLIPTLELMWQERPKELERILLERYINDSHHQNPPKVVFSSK
jgi:predicted RNase H-like HicB family nuclease